MPEQIRRHAVYVSDRELVVLERAVRAYVEVIRIQSPILQPQREANDAAHVAAVFQGHYSCTCPCPAGGKPMKTAFLIVAVILFALDALIYWTPNTSWGGRLLPLGLAFFAASFAVSG